MNASNFSLSPTGGRYRSIASGLILLLGICLATFSTNCAADTWLTLSGFAWHSGEGRAVTDGKGFNDLNPGIGVEVDKGRYFGSAGVYENSFRNWSKYAVAGRYELQWRGFRLGEFVGVVTGYPIYGGRPGPFIAPVISYQWRRVGVNMVVFPPAFKHAIVAFGWQLKVRVW